MALIFCDGFDTYTTLPGKWDASSGGGNSLTFGIQPGAGRGGAGAFSMLTPSLGGAGTATLQLVKDIGAHSSLFVGFAFKWNGAIQGSDQPILQFFDGSLIQISLFINASGTLSFRVGPTVFEGVGTNIGSSAIAYPANSYHFIEVEVVISATVGVAICRVDQVPVISLSGQNTKGTANTTFDSVQLCGLNLRPASYTGSWDDVYFNDSAFMGDQRVDGLLPIGNGSTQNFANVEATWVASTVTALQTTIFDGTNLQRATAITGDFKTGGSAPSWNVTLGGTTTDNHVTWTNIGTVSQYKLVNETNPDGDSSYINSNTLNDISRFLYAAISGSTIAAVVIWPYCRKDDGGFRTIQGAIKSGATIATTGTDVSPGTNYQYLMLISLIDPNTGVQWTISGVNAAELGLKITN